MDLESTDTTMVQVLADLSPSDILKSPTLLSCFHSFIAKCTEAERQLLFPLPSSNGTSTSTDRASSSCICDGSLHQTQRSKRVRRVQKCKLHCCGNSFFAGQDLRMPSDQTSGPSTCSPESSSPPSTPALTIYQSSRYPTENTALPSTFSFDSYPLLTYGSPTSSDAVSAVPIEAYSETRALLEQRLGSRSGRSKYLVRAIRGFVEAINLDPESFENLWSTRADIFQGSGIGPVARLHRLCDGIIRIQRGRRDYECASRLCHIFLEHDLEQLLKSGSFETSRGRGRKTGALSLQAANLSATVTAVKADRKAGRGYLQLLMENGPGLLLLVGSQVNTIWERKLSKSDISVLLQYLPEKHPEVLEKGRSIDRIAARLIFEGFLAYGWTYPELSAIQSKLLDRLKSYMDISEPQLQQESEVRLIARPDSNNAIPSSLTNFHFGNGEMISNQPASYECNGMNFDHVTMTPDGIFDVMQSDLSSFNGSLTDETSLEEHGEVTMLGEDDMECLEAGYVGDLTGLCFDCPGSFWPSMSPCVASSNEPPF